MTLLAPERTSGDYIFWHDVGGLAQHMRARPTTFSGNEGIR